MTRALGEGRHPITSTGFTTLPLAMSATASLMAASG
jgi:hypothetical protein